MLVDTLNVVGVPLPLASPGAASASGDAPSEMERWAYANAGSGGQKASVGQKVMMERWTQHLVNSEYARSRESGWRRLLPSAQTDYLPFLNPGRTLNLLEFEF